MWSVLHRTHTCIEFPFYHNLFSSILTFILTLCTLSSDIYAYVIHSAYVKCVYIGMGVTVAKPKEDLG